MKGLTIAACVGGVVMAGLGATLAATNPNSSAYEEFAAQRLSLYLREDACTNVPNSFGLQDQCRALVDSNQSQIKQLIAESTEQQNFILFSIYRTNLSVSSLLPSYQFRTVAVLGDFHIYQAKQSNGKELGR